VLECGRTRKKYVHRMDHMYREETDVVGAGAER